MKRIAIYCRVSSDDQKERETIENQIDILDTYIEFKDEFDVYQHYLDDGVSGTVPFENRPAGSNLIKDAEKGLFDIVLVWKIDRFGRDTFTGLSTVETLRKYDVEIVSVSEPFDLNTPTGRFQFITYLNMAELERNNILDRMFLGATRAAKKGKWLGGIVPYGYEVNGDGYLEIVSSEAEIIKRIFNLYTEDNKSLIDIAVYLNSLGVPSSCGSGKGKRTKKVSGLWNISTINRIIKSETYAGVHHYGKRSSKRKETITRKVPAIISREQYDKACSKRVTNQLDSMRNTTNRTYLLRRKLKCACCGRTYYGVSYKSRTNVYSCSGKKAPARKILGIKCDNVNLNADLIEEGIWADCKYILTHIDDYINEFKIKEVSTERTQLENEMSIFKSKLSSINTEKNSILNLFRKNLITEEELQLQLDEIRNDENKVKELLSTFENKYSLLQTENKLLDAAKEQLQHYSSKLDKISDEEKQSAIDFLVKEIVVSYEISEGVKKPMLEATYNFVKLDICTDKDLNSKFDIKKELLPIIYMPRSNEAIYHKLTNLRLKHNITRKNLASQFGISTYYLKKIELGTIDNINEYLHLYKDLFNIDIEEYLNIK